jgi:hypothetical protein
MANASKNCFPTPTRTFTRKNPNEAAAPQRQLAAATRSRAQCEALARYGLALAAKGAS